MFATVSGRAGQVQGTVPSCKLWHLLSRQFIISEWENCKVGVFATLSSGRPGRARRSADWLTGLVIIMVITDTNSSIHDTFFMPVKTSARLTRRTWSFAQIESSQSRPKTSYNTAGSAIQWRLRETERSWMTMAISANMGRQMLPGSSCLGHTVKKTESVITEECNNNSRDKNAFGDSGRSRT